MRHIAQARKQLFTAVLLGALTWLIIQYGILPQLELFQQTLASLH